MSGTRWLNDDEERAWRAYLRAHNRLTARLNRELQDGADLSLADYEVLVMLTDTPEGRLRPYELQRSLNWEQSRLSHHLKRMQRRGLVDRRECEDDGRGWFIELTAAGRTAIESAAPMHVGAVRRLFFDGLTADQIAVLEQVSEQVLHRLASPDQPAS